VGFGLVFGLEVFPSFRQHRGEIAGVFVDGVAIRADLVGRVDHSSLDPAVASPAIDIVERSANFRSGP
jgi:hypothetical protein